MTTTTVSQEAVEVTQADKAMAAEIARKLEIEDWATGGGYFAAQLLDCLARHRQQAERGEAEPVAYLYTRDDGSKDLVLDCNGEYARNLIEHGATEVPLYTLTTPPEAA